MSSGDYLGLVPLGGPYECLQLFFAGGFSVWNVTLLRPIGPLMDNWQKLYFTAPQMYGRVQATFAPNC